MAPQYSYAMKSSPLHRWELEITFLVLSQVVEHTNYDNHNLQVIWIIKTGEASWGWMDILFELNRVPSPDITSSLSFLIS